MAWAVLSWWELHRNSATVGWFVLQFEEVHKWSAERGHKVQVITGIPYYYRQFGYEMALDLTGRRIGFEVQCAQA